MTIRQGDKIIAGRVPVETFANTDLSNLTPAGEERVSNKASTSLDNLTQEGEKHFLGDRNITNCITEIPQDIKIEQKETGILIKAGTIFTYPMGKVDLSSEYPIGSNFNGKNFLKVVGTHFSNSNFFVRVELMVDKPRTTTARGSFNLSLDSNGTSTLTFLAGGYSGDTKPASFISGNCLWYDTSENKIKLTDNKGQTFKDEGVSLPIAVINGNGEKIDKIIQDFNGFGYIGSTIFALPNVKGLIPKGRNEDGSLKSELTVINNVILTNFSAKTRKDFSLTYNPSGHLYFGDYTYNKNTNYLINNFQKTKVSEVQVATFSTDSTGRITEFNPKQVFHAVDYSDLKGNVDSSLPVGTIFAHSSSASFVPENSLACNGTEYTKAQFPMLYTDWLVSGNLLTCTYEEYQQDMTTNGACAKFAIDEVRETFKVPTIPDGYYVKSGQGTANKAGLPNIKGEFKMRATLDNYPLGYAKGVFKDLTSGNSGTVAYDAHSVSRASGFTFDASRASSIYGKSNTVETNAVAYRYFVVVATGSIKQSEMDWSRYMNGLSSKLNTNMSNLPITADIVTEHKINSDGSWYRRYKSGWLEQGGVKSVNATLEVTLLKPYKDTNYIGLVSRNTRAITTSMTNNALEKISTTQIKIWTGTGTGKVENISWFTMGQGA